MKLFEQPGGDLRPRVFWAAVRLEDNLNILLDGETAEDGRLLGQVADSASGPQVHRQMGDRQIVEPDVSRLWSDQTDHDVEGRRLSGAVGAKQPHDLTPFDTDIDAVDDRAVAVPFEEPFGGQHATASSLSSRRGSRGRVRRGHDQAGRPARGGSLA